MLSTALLREAQELKNVSQRVELLADQHPHVSTALLAICGTISQTAMMMEVFVATKLEGRPI